ncbi:hypothetical protein MKX01_015303 [Papaver californicum]|nr:hypothetical protein MKX01_015303 [Papaver californicum]
MENKKMRKNIADEQSMLLCCNLYISESKNLAARLDRTSRSAAPGDLRYTLVSYVIHDSTTDSPIYSPLQQTFLAMVEAAYQAINLEYHSGAHPRLSVVDHICFHPLGREKLEEAVWLAKLVAGDIGNQLQARGIVVIGASPWVRTFNVPIMSTDVSITKRITQKVSARGGGLPTDLTEIACNLLEPNRVEVDCVQHQIALLAVDERLDVEKGYFTDYSPEMILEKYKKLVSTNQ